MIATSALSRLQPILRSLTDPVDGWLLFDFRGINPIMSAVVGPEVVGTRRSYVFFPREGQPAALVHAIDQELWRAWPAEWPKRIWVQREELGAALTELVGGKRIAAEYSPRGNVPYADYLPAGTAELLRSLGATLASSSELVTRYLSAWSPQDQAGHIRAAEHLRRIAREATLLAGQRARTADPISEGDLARWVLAAIERAGLVTESSPSVCYGPNAARNHYDPAAATSSDPIVPGNLLLLDLWATEPGRIYADQTYMASIGEPTARQQELWAVIRDARDAALGLLRSRASAREPVFGAEADRAARQVIRRAGYLGYTQCRTGHSIDHFGLHGYGPTLDDTESFDQRLLVPGAGFSVEPGIYFPGEVGVRSEVDACMGDGELLVTPASPQHDLWVV